MSYKPFVDWYGAGVNNALISEFSKYNDGFV